MATTMNDVLREWAEKYPEREAFTFFNRHGRHSICTSKELFQLAGRFAFELRRQGFQKGEVICNAIPNSVERLVTDYGVILAGCVTVNCQDFFDGEQAQNVRELWKGIAGEKCPIAFILPRDIIRLVEEFKIDPPEFKTEVIITGGQPITKVIMEALGVLTKALLLSYASSEASVVTNKYIADKADFQDFMCGTPFPGTDTCLRVVDEHMHDLESGKEGRILIKSSRVLRGYFNQVPASPIFTPDGWFITGDWGWLDENGDLFVSDRQDNVIHHGAILVYPSWPESILSRNPNVKEAAVIGIPDVTGGSKLCACVVLNKDASVSKNDLMKFYEDSFIKSHRQEYIPKLSFLQIMEEIPKTFNSKVDQRTLRSVMLDKLNIPNN